MRHETTRDDGHDVEEQLARYGTWLAARVGVPVVPPALEEPARVLPRARSRAGLVATGSVAIAAAVALVVWLGVADRGPRSGEPVVVGTEPSTRATNVDGTQTVVAQVLSDDASGLEATLRIDQGRAEGLAEGMAVVVDGGDARPVLVGLVAEVATHTATVRLLHDRESRISVWIPVYRQAGILAGQGDPERLSIDAVPISADERPRVGQIVETSGRDGSPVPSGLVVGSVWAVDDTPPGAVDTHVDVRPIADLERVTRVRVFTDPTHGEVVG
jgi:hypothetical protein